jgi:hypothetical protein
VAEATPIRKETTASQRSQQQKEKNESNRKESFHYFLVGNTFFPVTLQLLRKSTQSKLRCPPLAGEAFQVIRNIHTGVDNYEQ